MMLAHLSEANFLGGERLLDVLTALLARLRIAAGLWLKVVRVALF